MRSSRQGSVKYLLRFSTCCVLARIAVPVNMIMYCLDFLVPSICPLIRKYGYLHNVTLVSRNMQICNYAYIRTPTTNINHNANPALALPPARHHIPFSPQITMPWGLWSDAPSQPPNGPGSASTPSATSSSIPPSAYSATTPPPSQPTSSAPIIPPPQPTPIAKKDRPVSWNDSLNATDWAHYAEPRNWVPTAIAVVAALGLHQFYRSYLRRLPGTGHVSPAYFRRRSLLGKVTSVGDGDNFHLFHTPGGRLAGWGWLRKVPTGKKEVRGRTVSFFLSILSIFIFFYTVLSPLNLYLFMYGTLY